MKSFLPLAIILIYLIHLDTYAAGKKCVIVDTGQDKCYDNSREINFPKPGQPFFGQDAEYQGTKSAYKNNGDGTITDLNTGLTWSKAVSDQKYSLIEAEKNAKNMNLGGHKDWRVPNIKELYSLIDFRGYTGFSEGRNMSKTPANAIPFINTDFFDFKYGNTADGERYIDAQWLSSTKYVSKTMNRSDTLFGVNFADGRIKGYGYSNPRRPGHEKKFYVRFVRGSEYGNNDFVDNGDGTITDKSTGLEWMKKDSEKGMNWEEALDYAGKLRYAKHSDWRLPTAKELQYIVDYTRSPDATRSPAINRLFLTSTIKNEDGKIDFPYFWTSTTHLEGPNPGKNAAYIAFGRAIGKMREKVMDVHGAGAQRSDPKTGSPTFHGPQGDAVRIKNYVRCVRKGKAKLQMRQPKQDKTKYPYKIRVLPTKSTGQSLINRHSKDETLRNNTNRPTREEHFNKLDKNRDGKLSRKEFDGPKKHFRRLDRDGDGYISINELPTKPPSGGGIPKPPKN